MASGFSSGGGAQDFYTTGRSSSSPFLPPTMNLTNNNNNPSFRTNQIFLDQNFPPSHHNLHHHHQINQQPHRSSILPTSTATASLMGKRTLADFQSQHHHHHLQHQLHPQQPNLLSINNLLLRSVKPRNNLYQQNTSPISTLSPIEFSANNLSPPELPTLMSQRFGLPLLQQLRPQQQQQHQQSQMNNILSHGMNNINSTNPHVNTGGILMGQDQDKKMLNQLQELEKQLLDDDDEGEEGDAVSVITNSNSEWSETIQNLISSSCSNPISPSPTSSSSSSSSSCLTTVSTPISKQAVIEAASAIYESKIDTANEILTRASQVSNPRGNSEQRLMEHMLQALKSRVNPGENPPPVAELYSKEHLESTQLLYDMSPCFKLGFMAANLAIIDATIDFDQQMSIASNGFHVVDFDIGQGGQYQNLLHALSSRQPSKPAIVVKITAVADNNGGEEEERLSLVRATLCKVAESLGISLSFKIVSCKLSELTRDSLGCEPDEPLAVNFAFKLYRMPDESVSTENPRDELLRRVKGLGPRVVTIVEQEMNTNTAPFLARVNDSCSYYGALFDSISTVEPDNWKRVKVEEGLGRRIINSVACEGRDRVERCEVFGKWRARMGMAGFELRPMNQNVAESMKARLSSGNRVNPGFTVKEENGGVSFGWMGKTLTVASAWR